MKTTSRPIYTLIVEVPAFNVATRTVATPPPDTARRWKIVVKEAKDKSREPRHHRN